MSRIKTRNGVQPIASQLTFQPVPRYRLALSSTTAARVPPWLATSSSWATAAERRRRPSASRAWGPRMPSLCRTTSYRETRDTYRHKCPAGRCGGMKRRMRRMGASRRCPPRKQPVAVGVFWLFSPRECFFRLAGYRYERKPFSPPRKRQHTTTRHAVESYSYYDDPQITVVVNFKHGVHLKKVFTLAIIRHRC